MWHRANAEPADLSATVEPVEGDGPLSRINRTFLGTLTAAVLGAAGGLFLVSRLAAPAPLSAAAATGAIKVSAAATRAAGSGGTMPGSAPAAVSGAAGSAAVPPVVNGDSGGSGGMFRWTVPTRDWIARYRLANARPADLMAPEHRILREPGAGWPRSAVDPLARSQRNLPTGARTQNPPVRAARANEDDAPAPPRPAAPVDIAEATALPGLGPETSTAADSDQVLGGSITDVVGRHLAERRATALASFPTGTPR